MGMIHCPTHVTHEPTGSRTLLSHPSGRAGPPDRHSWALIWPACGQLCRSTGREWNACVPPFGAAQPCEITLEEAARQAALSAPVWTDRASLGTALDALLLRLGRSRKRSVPAPPDRPGRGRGTRTITAQITFETGPSGGDPPARAAGTPPGRSDRQSATPLPGPTKSNSGCRGPGTRTARLSTAWSRTCALPPCPGRAARRGRIGLVAARLRTCWSRRLAMGLPSACSLSAPGPVATSESSESLCDHYLPLMALILPHRWPLLLVRSGAHPFVRRFSSVYRPGARRRRLLEWSFHCRRRKRLRHRLSPWKRRHAASRRCYGLPHVRRLQPASRFLINTAYRAAPRVVVLAPPPPPASNPQTPPAPLSELAPEILSFSAFGDRYWIAPSGRCEPVPWLAADFGTALDSAQQDALTRLAHGEAEALGPLWIYASAAERLGAVPCCRRTPSPPWPLCGPSPLPPLPGAIGLAPYGCEMPSQKSPIQKPIPSPAVSVSSWKPCALRQRHR